MRVREWSGRTAQNTLGRHRAIALIQIILEASAAGNAHVPFHCRTRRFDPELMALGFAGEEPVERFVDRIRPALSKEVPELDFLIVAEATEDGSRRRDADALLGRGS